LFSFKYVWEFDHMLALKKWEYFFNEHLLRKKIFVYPKHEKHAFLRDKFEFFKFKIRQKNNKITPFKQGPVDQKRIQIFCTILNFTYIDTILSRPMYL